MAAKLCPVFGAVWLEAVLAPSVSLVCSAFADASPGMFARRQPPDKAFISAEIYCRIRISENQGKRVKGKYIPLGGGHSTKGLGHK